MKKLLVVLVFGFLVGSTLSGYFSPSMISWYFDPPTSIGISCKEAVVWGIGSYQKAILLGGIIGLACGALIFFLGMFSGRPPATPAQTPPGAPPNTI
jgi:hypothetical protein